MDGENPHYQYLQIELTNRCNLACTTCLRAVADIHLREQDLDPAIIRQLQPALLRTDAVHLQGWGEAMLLAELPRQISWFKEQGCRVSFTTSGSLMSRQQAVDLVHSGLDSITFSMAGATVSVQDDLRGAGTHAQLWQSMQMLKNVKQALASPLPILAVSYLLTRDTIQELPLAVKQCRSLEVELFAGVHLTHAATDRQQQMALLSAQGSGQTRMLKKNIIKANWQAIRAGIQLNLPVFAPELMPICDKNPLASCFIAADGSVAPCVFLSPPGSDKENVWFTDRGKRRAAEKRFGVLGSESLDQIWQSRQYRKFRRFFLLRQQLYNREMSRVGMGMDALERLEQARTRICSAFEAMPVPECCQFCPKMKGF